jgi:hypothetical protein
MLICPIWNFTPYITQGLHFFENQYINHRRNIPMTYETSLGCRLQIAEQMVTILSAWGTIYILIFVVSKAFGGRTSDKVITQHSGYLDKLEHGDQVLADRGFLIAEELANRNATLITSAFTKGKSQLSQKKYTHDLWNKFGLQVTNCRTIRYKTVSMRNHIHTHICTQNVKIFQEIWYKIIKAIVCAYDKS